MQIVLATSNAHKVEEINAITKDFGLNFVLPPGDFDPEENGETFEQNAYIKARAAWELAKMPTLADDSGLCVDALDGGPGIHSARYAPSASERIEKLLDALKDTPAEKRKAKFVCAMVLLDEKGEVAASVRGECHGEIALEAKGENGFGYDPIFLVDGYNLAMAELSEEEKNKISHRAKALMQILTTFKPA